MYSRPVSHSWNEEGFGMAAEKFYKLFHFAGRFWSRSRSCRNAASLNPSRIGPQSQGILIKTINNIQLLYYVAEYFFFIPAFSEAWRHTSSNNEMYNFRSKSTKLRFTKIKLAHLKSYYPFLQIRT
jgi:hypothetical protein